MIHDEDFKHQDLRFDPDYMIFTDWSMQQLAHFRTDPDMKGSFMLAQEAKAMKKLKTRFVSHEKKPGETTEHFEA